MWVATWNVQWATPASRRTHELLRRLERYSPEVVCLTETHVELLSRSGHTVSAQRDYGYEAKETRRKVVLWSQQPWTQVDCVGNKSLPPGRFVAGVTQTSLGEVTVIGIGIPWFGSRTEASRNSGRRRRWQDHEEYLVGLTEVLARAPTKRLLIMGDFNQALGAKGRAPTALRQALLGAFPPTVSIATSSLAFGGRESIDHIALSEDLVVQSLHVLGNIQGAAVLSDHFGIVAEVSGKAADHL